MRSKSHASALIQSLNPLIGDFINTIDHLRHQRAIFAVVHSGILAHRCGNVRP
jgi:hypothetical protein